MSRRPNPANLLSLDYSAESLAFRRYEFPIIDCHTHINGDQAIRIYGQAARAFGIELTYSMTHFSNIDKAREILQGRIRFITMLQFTEEERYYRDARGYIAYVEKFYEKGSRIIKFWSAPRGVDYADSAGMPDLLSLNSPVRKEVIKHTASMGMIFMVHVADPDTWFSTRYTDQTRYGSKIDQYVALEQLLSDYRSTKVIAAHMAGWPEDLEFLSVLMERHDNLYLDTSATKWMVREISKHSREEIVAFMERWKGRILFGSDIVSKEEHCKEAEEAFDLYASRYWALRKLLETDYDGPSPISDPDLALVDPKNYAEDSSPALKGKNLPDHILKSLYYDAPRSLLEEVHKA